MVGGAEKCTAGCAMSAVHGTWRPSSRAGPTHMLTTGDVKLAPSPQSRLLKRMKSCIPAFRRYRCSAEEVRGSWPCQLCYARTVGLAIPRCGGTWSELSLSKTAMCFVMVTSPHTTSPMYVLGMWEVLTMPALVREPSCQAGVDRRAG